MARNEHLVLCGGAPKPRGGWRRGAADLYLQLNNKTPGLLPNSRNVTLQIENISKQLTGAIPDILLDLLEVAAYVHAADGATPRGGGTDFQLGKRWRRGFRFVIPVRCQKVWARKTVSDHLVGTLTFLSDDEFEFDFQPHPAPPSTDCYFECAEEAAEFSPDKVMLFSGGLDALAGAVEQLADTDKKVALVSHRLAAGIPNALTTLVADMQRQFGANRIMLVPVWAGLDGKTDEASYRSASFLLAALGLVIARLWGKDQCLIPANGVASMNLPPVAHAVGARAARTTHPQALDGFRHIFGQLLGSCFQVNNPFVWMTKKELIEIVAGHSCATLIQHTRSCIRIENTTKHEPHCGRCWQCLNRRFAVLAAGQVNAEQNSTYRVELFNGSRPAGPDRELALALVRSASDIDQMTDTAFLAHYGEVSRIVRYFGRPANDAAKDIFDLHRRHARDVRHVFAGAVGSNATSLMRGSLPVDCLIRLIIGPGVSHQPGQNPYPAPQAPAQMALVVGPEIRIAIDQARTRVVFEGWGEIKGEGAKLIIVLAWRFRAAARAQKAPENFPFMESGVLEEKTNCPDNETQRKRVQRLRNKIEKLATNAGDKPARNDVVEHLQSHGYRLNPDRIRIVAPDQLREPA